MDFFEKEGVIYKHVPAGGMGGGVTSSVVVKATDAEAEDYRASLLAVPEEPSVKIPQADAMAIEQAVEKAEADAHNET